MHPDQQVIKPVTRSLEPCTRDQKPKVCNMCKEQNRESLEAQLKYSHPCSRIPDTGYNSDPFLNPYLAPFPGYRKT